MSAKNEELNIPSSLIFLECMKFFMHGNNSILLADSSRIIKIESQLELFIHELVLLVWEKNFSKGTKNLFSKIICQLEVVLRKKHFHSHNVETKII